MNLRDGTPFRIRSIRPEDKAMLSAGHASLTPETQYRRFLAPKPRLSARELRYLTEVDFVDHHAVLAVTWDHPERLLGVARWVRSTEDPKSADIAFVVGDEVQGQGVGRALSLALADQAAGLGIRRFTADILPGNHAAQALFAASNARLGAVAAA